ncbi:MAG: triose-phosphate isomerase [Actinomycetota bacterium]|nr:triose-phosphate isomerase [Actinomycetota bacterium]
MRTPLIAGNWKMHKDNAEAVELIEELVSLLGKPLEVEVAVCPPFTSLPDVSGVLEKSRTSIRLGAQNVYPAAEGAFTGEISPLMLKALKVHYVIVGHSERREIFGESDEMVSDKLRAVLDNRLFPILCVGETLQEREGGEAESKVRRQLSDDLKSLDKEEITNLVIAYEPIWAIGTGKTATPRDAQDMTSLIREKIAGDYGDESADEIRILYGGSVKPDNIVELMAMHDIDGALVGGGSLDAISFSRIALYGT